ncbi:unnamed protein product [Rhizophagus irregularis]|nr:unnamed protein product [Rhizophagus irregularis]CAB5375157.1 unnamed protein product [Rhizophagus irregularis]
MFLENDSDSGNQSSSEKAITFKEGNDNDNSNTLSREHVLKYDDILKLEGIGWIEYTLPFSILTDNNMEWIQPSIDMKNHSIIMQIDYVQFQKYIKDY